MSEALLRKLEQLERRVQALADERAIDGAFSRYNRAVNYGGDLEPLFTEDAWVEVVSPEGRTLVRQEGVAAYAAHRAPLPVPPERWAMNLALERLTEIDGDVAEVDNYFVVVADDDGRPQVANYGRARTTLVRGPGGWVIASRRAEVESPAFEPRDT
jgi:hypothetical protein